MNCSFYKASALKLLALLVMTSSLAGCLHLQTTPTGATEADREVTAGVCSVWLPTTYSSRDTEETQLGNRANNAARDIYCT